MTQFFNKFKNPCFWPIFPIFGAKKIFLENPVLSCATSYGFLAPCQNLEKVYDTIQRKHLDRQKDGQKDGQTLFYRTLPATTGAPTNQNFKFGCSLTIAITEPKNFKKIFDLLDLLLMINKRCLIKLQKMSTNNTLSQYFVLNIVLCCFISYIDFTLATNKTEMEKSVKNRTTTNQI